MKQNDDDKSVVLFPNETVGCADNGGWTIHQLPDPYTGELRSYWKSETNNSLHELYSIRDDEKFCTFFLGNDILASNKLHVATAVDPLFWLVYFGDNNNNKSTTAWQPLDQLLQTICGSNEYYALISSCLVDTSQCQHVFATLRMDEDSDELYYKFCWKTTAKWLKQKQERLALTLRRRRQEQDQNNTGGAFVEGFVLGKGSTDTAPATTGDETHPEDQAASYQLVGNYLTASARERWMQELGLEGEQFWGGAATSTKKKPKVSLEPEDHWDVSMGGEAEKVKTVKPRPVTAGAKRLQKVNKRGMQKMSSFSVLKRNPLQVVQNEIILPARPE